MHKNQKFQRAWTSKKFQSLLFLEDMLWSEKESPIPSFLSCRRLLPWLISYLYCSRLSTEHLTLSSPRAKMYLYLCIQMALWKECSATWELGILLAAVCRTEANEQSINSAWLKRQSENIWVGQSLVELVGCMLSSAEHCWVSQTLRVHGPAILSWGALRCASTTLWSWECNRAESSGPQLGGNGALEAFPPSPTSTIVFGVWNWMKNGLTALHGKGNIDRGANCEFCAFPQTFKHAALATQPLFALLQPWMVALEQKLSLVPSCTWPPGWSRLDPYLPSVAWVWAQKKELCNPFKPIFISSPTGFSAPTSGASHSEGKYIFQPDSGADQTR